LALAAGADRRAHGVEQDLPVPAHALLVVGLGVAGVHRKHQIGDAGLHHVGEQLGVLAGAAVAVGVHHDVGEAQLGGRADERHDAGVQRRLAPVVQLDGADPQVGALLDQPAGEAGVNVPFLVGVLVETLGPDVLVGPDLAEPLRVLLGAAAAQVADRDALQVDVHRVIGGIQLGFAAVPLPAVGFVALAAVGLA